jgi:hypothetical protein
LASASIKNDLALDLEQDSRSCPEPSDLASDSIKNDLALALPLPHLNRHAAG